MNIRQLVESRLFDSIGTFAGCKLSEDTSMKLQDFCIRHNVPQFVPVNKHHITMLFSKGKVLPDYVPIYRYDNPIVIPVGRTSYDLFGKTDPKTVLVIKLDSPELVRRNKSLVDIHKPNENFPDYKPHCTIAYDVMNYDMKKLPPIDFPIIVIGEYVDDIKDNW